MPDSNRREVDLISELQMRRWARENYVPEPRRDGGWHPLVLHEMKLRDAELNGIDDRLSSRAYGFVPLPPTSIPRLDQPHRRLDQPKLLQAIEPTEIYVHG